jgi:hypothetical protein
VPIQGSRSRAYSIAHSPFGATTTDFGTAWALSRSSNERSASGWRSVYPKMRSFHRTWPSIARA